MTDTGRWVDQGHARLRPARRRAIARAAVVVCDIPIGVLTDDAPVYDRPRAGKRTSRWRRPVLPGGVPVADDLRPSCSIRSRLAQHRLAAVGVAPVRPDRARRYAGAPGVRRGRRARAVREGRRRPSNKLLAFAVDCNGRTCELDPFVGAAMAVAEVCRNLVCSGAEPSGDHRLPELRQPRATRGDGAVRARHRRARRRLQRARRADRERQREPLQRDRRRRDPPHADGRRGGSRARRGRHRHAVVQAAGRRRGAVRRPSRARAPGALGGASTWCASSGGSPAARRESISAAEAKLQKLVLELARAHVLQSAHDVSDGGLAVALAECCVTAPRRVGGRGRADRPARSEQTRIEAAALFFGEDPSRIVVSVRPSALASVLDARQVGGCPRGGARRHRGALAVDSRSPPSTVSGPASPPSHVPLATLRDARERCLESIIGS